MKKVSLIILFVLLCSLCGCSGRLAVEAADAPGEEDVPIGIAFLTLTAEEFNGETASVDAFELLFSAKDGVIDDASITADIGKPVYLCANYCIPEGEGRERAQKLIITGGMHGSDVTYKTDSDYWVVDTKKEMTVLQHKDQTATVKALACTTETDQFLTFYEVYERRDGSLYCKNRFTNEFLSHGSLSVNRIMKSQNAWTVDFEGSRQVDVTITVECRPQDLAYTLTFLDRDNRPVGETVTLAADGVPSGIHSPENAAFLLLRSFGTDYEDNTLYNLAKDSVPVFVADGGNDGMLRVRQLDIK